MTFIFFLGVKVPKAVVSGEAREIQYKASVFNHLLMPRSVKAEKKERREHKKLVRMDQTIHDTFGEATAGVNLRPLSRVLIKHDNARIWLLERHDFSEVISVLKEDDYFAAAGVVEAIAHKVATVAA